MIVQILSPDCFWGDYFFIDISKLKSAYADIEDENSSSMYIYLLHFNKPINPNRPAQHYLDLGFTKNLDERILQHRQGKGARLTQVALEREISFKVAEVWKGDRYARKTIETPEK